MYTQKLHSKIYYHAMKIGKNSGSMHYLMDATIITQVRLHTNNLLGKVNLRLSVNYTKIS